MTQCKELPHCHYTRNQKTKCRKLSLREKISRARERIKVEKKLDKKTKKNVNHQIAVAEVAEVAQMNMLI